MALYRDEAVVLRTYKLGEADRIIVLFTRGRGKVRAVAKGVRRITAVAGEPAKRAAAHADVLTERIEALGSAEPESLAQDLASIHEAMETSSLPMIQRQKLRDAAAELQKVVKEHQKQQGKAAEGEAVDVARKLAESAEGPLIISAIAGADARTLRNAMDVIRAKRPEAAMLLAAVAEGKVAFLASVPKPLIEKGLKAGDWVREVATVAGGSGGGRPDMAQAGGKNPAKLDEALETARQFAEAKL